MFATSKHHCLDIGDCKVGDGYPCFVITEIGTNDKQDSIFPISRAAEKLYNWRFT